MTLTREQTDHEVLYMLVFAAVTSFILSLALLYIIRLYVAGDTCSSGDVFFHLLIIESIKEHRWKYPSSLQNVVFDCDFKPYNYLAYPPLFHYIAALFPARLQKTITRMLNLVLLSFVSSLASIFVFIVTSSFPLAVVSAFVTTFNLSNFENTVTFTPRPLGLLSYSLLVCVTLLFPQSLFSILAVTILVMLINLSHKFATQMTLFGLLPYIFVFGRFDLLLSITFGFLLSVVVSKGFYLKILREHYNWLSFYSAIHHDMPNKTRRKLVSVLSRNLWYLSVVIAMALYFIWKNGNLLSNDLTAKIYFWAFIPVVTAFIVSVPALSFLGEEYRYVQYSVVPVGIICSLQLGSPNLYVWPVFFACSFMIFLELYKFKKYVLQSQLKIKPCETSAYNCLRNHKLGKVLVFPHIRTLEVNYFTKLQVVHFVRPGSKTYEDRVRAYGVEYALIFKGDDKAFLKLKSTFDMSRVLTSPIFEVYKLRPTSQPVKSTTS